MESEAGNLRRGINRPIVIQRLGAKFQRFHYRRTFAQMKALNISDTYLESHSVHIYQVSVSMK